jgi:glyoxylase-like metal-dependent hydrolase (beta-lactamase superfamily II)
MIPFNREFDFSYGVAASASQLVRRVVARNPGRFTGPGTGTLLVGETEVAIVDPGPDRDDHFEALNRALFGQRLTHVFVTHNHMDHSALARRLAGYHGAILCGRSGGASEDESGASRQEASDDHAFAPDHEIDEGELFVGRGWTLEAMHTPGHTAGHFCFALQQEHTLLCGDHVMAWSTSIVTPPDGHMGDYISSLQKIRSKQFARLIPTHGPSIEAPDPFIGAYVDHRLMRRGQILERLNAGDTTIREIVSALYLDLDVALRPAAAINVWAHLIHLVEEGHAFADPLPELGARYIVRRRAA